MTLTFANLGPEAREAFAAYVDDDLLAVTNEAKWGENGGEAKHYGNSLRCPDFARIRGLAGKEKRTAHNGLVDGGTYADLKKATKVDEVESALSTWEQANPDRCTRVRDEGQFFGWTNVGVGRIDRFSKWLFIPAVRDPASEGVEGKGNALKILLDLFLRAKLANNEELRRLQSETTRQFRSIINPSRLTELRQLSDALSQRLSQFAPGTSVQVGWQDMGEVRVALPNAETQIREGSFLAPVEVAGHGTQRAFLIAILQHLVHSKIALEQEETPEPHILLAIEEPELYLHPVRARLMNRVLRLLSESSEGRTPIQSIYATHSPLLVDIGDFRSVRLVRRSVGRDGQPGVTSVTAADVEAIARRLGQAFEKNSEEFTWERLHPRLATVMTTVVSEGFFADATVLVEGPEDAALLRAAAKQLGHELDELGIAILPVEGKTNLDRPFVIFQSLGISVFMVFDGDHGKTKDAHPETNKALLQLSGQSPEEFPDTRVWPSGACPLCQHA